ncbi:Ecp43-1 [Fulvia fulva]|uniref:Ecp43-1 n=1 Tax=Passalora fulva TaxID=5499 RepID=A0A1P8YXM4_PASFU|nr:Ecp43-1 [Fulvia fulva]AQA29260.1 extracellular protein 43-1 [Fulvia fulva]KAK4634867.1 Ecp43-1 [Fulvia fulva]KAK4637959.1 Ecp43-1 [Fulvia fulva]UJO12544.1 Ecp43-1 [Fulvia fulva]WPV09813.1 Ecp43-1 [Fulvia fulva]
MTKLLLTCLFSFAVGFANAAAMAADPQDGLSGISCPENRWHVCYAAGACEKHQRPHACATGFARHPHCPREMTGCDADCCNLCESTNVGYGNAC